MGLYIPVGFITMYTVYRYYDAIMGTMRFQIEKLLMLKNATHMKRGRPGLTHEKMQIVHTPLKKREKKFHT